MLKVISVFVIIASLLVVTVSGCSPGFTSSPDRPTAPLPDNVAPDFQLRNLEGQAVSLSDFRGRPVLLNFWASWCGPCRAEMPFLQKVYEDAKWQQSGLAILAVNLQESPDTVAEFMASNGLTFPVLLDRQGNAGLRYNVRAIPATFPIDKDGIMRYAKVGAFSGVAEIEQLLESNIVKRG